MKTLVINKCHIFHIFVSSPNLMFIRGIFLNQVILVYGHNSSTISTIYAKDVVLSNKYVISMIFLVTSLWSHI